MFNIDQILNAIKTDPNTRKQAMTGAGGLAAGLLLGGKGGDVLKLGALAAVGGLAYQAWQRHQQQSGGTAASGGGIGGALGSLRDAFIPREDSPEQEELGKTLVRAMIAAAKADGVIDGEEKQRIFSRLETMSLTPDEKAFVFDELSGPLDIDAVVARADTPEHAAEIYAASLVAIDSNSEAERTYLKTLATRLRLQPGLVTEIHRAADKPLPA